MATEFMKNKIEKYIQIKYPRYGAVSPINLKNNETFLDSYVN